MTVDFGDLKFGIPSAIGKADLRLGDCLDILRTLPDDSVDLVITDPPYVFDNLTEGGWARGKKVGKYFEELSSLSEGMNFEVLDECLRVLKKTNLYIWGNWQCIKDYMAYFQDKDVKSNLLTWHKANPPPLCGNGYLKDTEYCLFVREEGVKLYGGYKDLGTYWVTPLNTKDKERYGHPTVKPLEIIRQMVRNSTDGGGMLRCLTPIWVRERLVPPVCWRADALSGAR